MKYIIIWISAIVTVACSKSPGKLNPPKLDSEKTDVSNITLILKEDSVVADNKTYGEFTFKLDPALVNSYKSVTFNITPFGKFSNGTSTVQVSLDVNGEAKAYVFSDAVGISNVSASITNLVTKQTSINFIPAWPTGLFIEPAVSFMTPTFTSQTIITAKVSRADGTVSNGLPVFFSDSTVSNNSIGIFLNTTKTNSAQATTQYWLQDTSYHGFVYIKAYMMTDQGIVRGRSKIFIQ